MDILSLKHASYRIKGKQATITVLADGSLTVEDRTGESSYTIHGPGEYEVKGVGVIGVSREGSTIYRCEIDGVSFVYTGNITKPLATTDIENLDGVDILITPLSSVVSEIEPSVVIPMLEEKEALIGFLKELGKEDVIPQPKFSITRDKIPEQMQVIVLE